MKKPSADERADASAWLLFKRGLPDRLNSHICLAAVHLARKGQVGLGVNPTLNAVGIIFNQKKRCKKKQRFPKKAT